VIFNRSFRFLLTSFAEGYVKAPVFTLFHQLCGSCKYSLCQHARSLVLLMGQTLPSDHIVRFFSKVLPRNIYLYFNRSKLTFPTFQLLVSSSRMYRFSIPAFRPSSRTGPPRVTGILSTRLVDHSIRLASPPSAELLKTRSSFTMWR